MRELILEGRAIQLLEAEQLIPVQAVGPQRPAHRLGTTGGSEWRGPDRLGVRINKMKQNKTKQQNHEKNFY